MVNKRGWIRIVEASIAILIIASSVFIIYRGVVVNKEFDLTQIITPILEEIGKNITLREKILSYQPSSGEEIPPEIRDFVSARIKKPYLNYTIKICDPNFLNGCALENYPENARSGVYADERIISGTVTQKQFSPKKIKIFLWEMN